MNMCLLEVAMCEKCRSSHFQSEGEGSKKFQDWGVKKILELGGTFAGGGGGSVPHILFKKANTGRRRTRSQWLILLRKNIAL